MRIYIAGAFESLLRLRDIRARIDARRNHVISTWLDEQEGYVPPTPEQAFEYAVRGLGEIRAADLLLLDTLDTNERGGREWEGGFAFGQGLRVWVIGPRRSVFHTLVERHFDTWEEALGWL